MEENNHGDDGDEDDVVIEIPIPGLHQNNDMENLPLRRSVGLCTICLSTYQVRSDVIWSSNTLCDHVFHAECIIDWLLRQKDEGMPCPCCRRNFIEDNMDDNNDLEQPPILLSLVERNNDNQIRGFDNHENSTNDRSTVLVQQHLSERAQNEDNYTMSLQRDQNSHNEVIDPFQAA